MNKWVVRALILSAVIVGGTVAGYGFILSSKSYQLAVDFAKTSPQVREEVGIVESTHLDLIGSNFDESEESGDANLTLDVQGTKSKAKLIVSLTKYAGTWRISSAGINGLKIFSK